MEGQMDASRPALGFPLGTAMLMILVFTLSGIFSCCYHWDKIRSLRRSFSSETTDMDTGTVAASDTLAHSNSKTSSPDSNSKQNQNQSLPVLMPGDRIPKFIAWPCPCEHLSMEKIMVEVQAPPNISATGP